MIIDIHTHLFESLAAFPKVWLDEMVKYKRKAVDDEAFRQWRAGFDQSGSTEALIADMDEAGVDKSVALPLDYAIMCRQEAQLSIWEINRYIAEAQRKHPDRIIGFVGVDPLRGKEAIDLLETAVKEWGLKGVKIFQTTFKVTDSSVQAFFSKVNELELPVLFHTGSDPLPYTIQYGDPADLDTLSLWYPKMKIIAAHYGKGYEDLVTAILFYKRGVMYTDISGLQHEFKKSPWHFTLQMRYLLDKVPHAALMGSDWPMIKTPPVQPTHKEWVDAVRDLKIPEPVLQLGLGIRDFSQEEKEMILGENARRLLGI